jgi:hypothetical protein
LNEGGDIIMGYDTEVSLLSEVANAFLIQIAAAKVSATGKAARLSPFNNAVTGYGRVCP